MNKMNPSYLSQKLPEAKVCFVATAMAIATLPSLQHTNSVIFPQYEKPFSSNLTNSSYQRKYFTPEVENFLDKHPMLYNFINQLTSLINQVYGKITTDFTVWESPIDKTDSHLRITVFSNLETDEEITEKEEQLFALIEQNEEMLSSLEYVVIAQHWKNV